MTVQSNAALGKFPGTGYGIDLDDHPDPLTSIASRILDDVRKALPHDLNAASTNVARLAALLHERLAPPPAPPVANRGGLGPWQENRILHHIDGNIGNSIGSHELAALLSLSVGHFCRAFKSSFSTTPHAYILSRRIQRAKEIMIEGDLPLSQIALDCGFSDQAHFCRVFRQLTGLTPSGWRRVWASEGSEEAFSPNHAPLRHDFSPRLAICEAG